MIPKIIQRGPTVVPKYFCSECGSQLQNVDRLGSITKGRWAFCPMCGEKIEWDKANPVKWEEQSCGICGCRLIFMTSVGMMASSDYIGTKICRDCQMEFCRTTNCLGCEMGTYPNCEFTYLKQLAIADKEEGGDAQ